MNIQDIIAVLILIVLEVVLKELTSWTSETTRLCLNPYCIGSGFESGVKNLKEFGYPS